MYLSQFKFPTSDEEFDFFLDIKRTCYDSFYPFQVLSGCGFRQIDFEAITILHGGNGSGKTTALNVIAEKLHLTRGTLYNKSNFFENYVEMCECELEKRIPSHSRIITSDDVFDYMLDVRALNSNIDYRREDLFAEFVETKHSKFRLESIEELERLKKIQLARTKTQSKYIRATSNDNIREHSNGENAFTFFSDKITENALYVLDEPENSLSPERQLELVQFIEDSARFYGCQFIISTHSPFLLSIKNAKIYDMDEEPVDVKHWKSLKNVQIYFDFFQSNM